MRFILVGNVCCIDELKEGDAKSPSSAESQERALEAESAWSLLRETFECRDFDDSLVFAE